MIYQNPSSTPTVRLTSELQKNAPFKHQGFDGVSGFLLWFHLWVACTVEGFLVDIGRAASPPKKHTARGYQRPRSLLPNAARSAMAPRVLVSRRSKRILARGLPASRRYFSYEHLNARQLTGNQFLERAAKLSVNGRLGVYRLEYRLRLCQSIEPRLRKSTRLKDMTLCPRPWTPKFRTLNAGVCEVHLYPA